MQAAKLRLVETSPAPPEPLARATLLDAILRLSEQMLEAAEGAHWDALGDAECERQRLVWLFFERPLSEAEAAALSPRLERVLSISQELSRLGQAERARLSDEMAYLERGRQARVAYGAHAP